MVAKAIIIDEKKINTVRIETKNAPKPVVRYVDNRQVRINEVLPFRVRFTSVKIPGYGPSNIPAIPLQVIGYSNYIL